MSTDEKTTDRWDAEASFFDREAEAARSRLNPVSERALLRYRSLRRRRWNKEFRFRLLGDLSGLRVLDVGCGDGSNSMLLALQGAVVTGVDISANAIEVAKERARINKVDDRTRFICAPFEDASLPAASFDVIWIDAVLHHLIPVLPESLRQLRRLRAKGGVLIATEPVTLNRSLRALRLRLPVSTHATPDERPLEDDEIAEMARVFPELMTFHFHLLARVMRWVLPDHTLETASLMRRFIANAICLADVALFVLPPMRALAGVCVFYERDVQR